MRPAADTPIIPDAASRDPLRTGLLLAAAAVLCGRGYEYVCWGGRLRVALWDQDLFSPVASALFGSWETYAADLRVDAAIAVLEQGIGAFLLLAGVFACTLLRNRPRRLAAVLLPAVALLTLDAVLRTRDHFWQLAQLCEFALQVGTPLLALAYVRGSVSRTRLLQVGCALTGVTFVAHGLYAAGVYPVPGHFVDMTIALTGLSEAGARSFLLAAGWADFAVGVALLFRATRRPALAYACGWGLLTALARVVYGFDVSAPLLSLHAWAFETVVRLPHGLVPALLIVLLGRVRAGTGAKILPTPMQLNRLSPKPVLRALGVGGLVLLAVQLGYGRAERFRLVVSSDPATSATVGWDQVSGADPTLHLDVYDYGGDVQRYAHTHYPATSNRERGMHSHFVRLTGLRANTAYYFVVRDTEGVSRRYWFKTAPDDGSPLAFVAGGDSRNNRTPRRNANLLVAKLKPHAVLFGGDMIDRDAGHEWREWFDDWQLTTSPDGRLTPIVPARGNHEAPPTIGWLFDTPPDVYYAMNWSGGLVRTYTLNSEISVLGEQLRWLRDDLAGQRDRPWRIAQYHKPMRPHIRGKREGVDEYRAWAGLFAEERVQLAVECDSHTAKTTWPIVPSRGPDAEEGFERDDARGTTYVGEGCWGAPLHNFDDAKSWTRSGGAFNQFNLIHVRRDAMEVRVVLTDSVAQVASNGHDAPLGLPTGLAVHRPDNGAVIVLPADDLACADAGTACDDFDAGTVDDRLDADCVCVGTPDQDSLALTVCTSLDDAVEGGWGAVTQVTGPTLSFVPDYARGDTAVRVGLRFDEVTIPPGSEVTSAQLQFASASASGAWAEARLVIRAATGSAEATRVFAAVESDIAGRLSTHAHTVWRPPAWTAHGQADSAQRTPNLAAVLQELIDAPDWTTGSPVVLMLTGRGTQVAAAYEDGVLAPPTLLVHYRQPRPAPVIELERFGGARTPEGVTLTWVAAREVGLAHYVVERLRAQVHWDSIGVVVPRIAGDTVAYGHVDDLVAPQADASYRLRVVDELGAATYSEAVVLDAAPFASTTDDGSPDELPRPYPNPTRGPLYVGACREVWVVDAAGVERLRAVGAERIDLGGLARGVYAVHVRGADGSVRVEWVVRGG